MVKNRPKTRGCDMLNKPFINNKPSNRLPNQQWHLREHPNDLPRALEGHPGGDLQEEPLPRAVQLVRVEEIREPLGGHHLKPRSSGARHSSARSADRSSGEGVRKGSNNKSEILQGNGHGRFPIKMILSTGDV